MTFPNKKIQIKSGCEGFEVRNNFPCWNFSRFRIEFELKFKETSRVSKSMKFDRNFEI
jgi:hypothetical protein